MKGVMAYLGMVFKRWCVWSYFQAQRLGKGQWISIGKLKKSKFRRRNKEYVRLCSTGVLEKFSGFETFLFTYHVFLTLSKKNMLRFWLLLCISCWRTLMGSWTLFMFCLSKQKCSSGIVKPITCISLDLGATWGDAESCLCCEEHHRVPWDGEQQKRPLVWGAHSNTSPAHSGFHRRGFYIWILMIKQKKKRK